MATSINVQYKPMTKFICWDDSTTEQVPAAISKEDYHVISCAISNVEKGAFVKFMFSGKSERESRQYYILVTKQAQSSVSSYNYKVFERIERKASAAISVSNPIDMPYISTVNQSDMGGSCTTGFNETVRLTECGTSVAKSLFQEPQPITTLPIIEENDDVKEDNKPQETETQKGAFDSKDNPEDLVKDYTWDWRCKYVTASHDISAKHQNFIKRFFEQANIAYKLNQYAYAGETRNLNLSLKNSSVTTYLDYADSLGLTPIKRAMVKHKTSTFIFLYEKMKKTRGDESFDQLTKELLFFASERGLHWVIPCIDLHSSIKKINDVTFWQNELVPFLIRNPCSQLFQAFFKANNRDFVKCVEETLVSMVKYDTTPKRTEELTHLLAQICFDKKVSPNIFNKIIKCKRYDLISFLAQQGIKCSEGSPAHCRIHSVIGEFPLSILGRLLPDDYEVNHVDEDGNTLLHLAFKMADFDSVIWLLNTGVDSHLANHEGVTALAFPDNDTSGYVQVFRRVVNAWAAKKLKLELEDDEQFLMINVADAKPNQPLAAVSKQTIPFRGDKKNGNLAIRTLKTIDAYEQVSVTYKYELLCELQCKDEFLADLHRSLPSDINHVLTYLHENKLYYFAFLFFEANPQLKVSDCLLYSEFKEQLEVLEICFSNKNVDANVRKKNARKLEELIKTNKHLDLLNDQSLPFSHKSTLRSMSVSFRTALMAWVQ